MEAPVSREVIRAYFQEKREELTRELVELTRDLVAARTVNPGRELLAEFDYMEVSGQETRAALVAASYLERWGIPYRIVDGAPQRGNLLASIGAGRPELLFGLHTDVVSPGTGWDTEPFEVVEKDGFLYGRGVLDDKGPMASSMIAMKVLHQLNIPLKGTLTLAGIASEEYREPGEQDPGLEFLFENKLLKPDFAIIPDIGEFMKRIDVAEKGRAVYTLVAKGVQAHGSTPERGISSFYMMARVLTMIESLRLDHEVHPVLESPTMNPGVIRGGGAANIVPETCMVKVDVRFVPGQTAEGIRAELEAAGRAAVHSYLKLDPRVDFTVTTDTFTMPHGVDPTIPLVQVIQRCGQEVLGFTPETFGMGGGTFAKAFNLAGVPAVGYGPGDDEQFHVINEHIALKELVEFAELLSLVAVDMLS